jgi:hypothetical protein
MSIISATQRGPSSRSAWAKVSKTLSEKQTKNRRTGVCGSSGGVLASKCEILNSILNIAKKKDEEEKEDKGK